MYNDVYNYLSYDCEKKCTQFYRKSNKVNAQELINNIILCINYGSNKSNDDLLRFTYMFFGSYCLNNYFKIFRVNQKIEHYFSEIIINRNLIVPNDNIGLVRFNLKLMRKLKMFAKHLLNNHKSSVANVYSNIRNLNINYALLLNSIGRTIPAIRLYINNIKFFVNDPTVHSNMGIALALYGNMSGYDYFRYLALKHIEYSLYLFSIQRVISREDKLQIRQLLVVMKLLIPVRKDFKLNYTKLKIKKDILYRKWSSKCKLLLNVLNDVNFSSKVINDSIQLSHKVYEYEPDVFNLFNLIKQEYVSARYELYLGVIHKGSNSCDRRSNVYFTHKFKENYHIEQIKNSLDLFYSIFDKIASLLNNYFNLGIRKRTISFSSLYKRRNMNELFNVYPNNVKLSSSNLALEGLYWMSQDFYDKYKQDGLDYKLYISNQIRNSITHRGFYVVNDKIHGSEYVCNNNDNTYTVSWAEFYNVTLHLAHVAREAIILTSIAINNSISGRSIVYFPSGNSKLFSE